MIEFTLQHVGVYRHRETGVQCHAFDCLTLLIADLQQFDYGGVAIPWSLPCFLLCPRQVPCLMQFGDQRENWTLLLEMPHTLRPGTQAGTVEVSDGISWIELPALVPVPPEQVPGWRWEFQRLRAAQQDPIPRNRLRAQLGVMEMLRFILDHAVDTPPVSPAGQFKELIDADTAFAQSLAQLSARCCYSADHLRLLFQQEYRVSPLQYRNQRRMALAMELISKSHLSVKEIAARLNFEYVSHFSAMFRRTFGIPPSEGIRKYRYAGPPTAST